MARSKQADKQKQRVVLQPASWGRLTPAEVARAVEKVKAARQGKLGAKAAVPDEPKK